jgi:hypothetical protein
MGTSTIISWHSLVLSVTRSMNFTSWVSNPEVPSATCYSKSASNAQSSYLVLLVLIFVAINYVQARLHFEKAQVRQSIVSNEAPPMYPHMFLSMGHTLGFIFNDPKFLKNAS